MSQSEQAITTVDVGATWQATQDLSLSLVGYNLTNQVRGRMWTPIIPMPKTADALGQSQLYVLTLNRAARPRYSYGRCP